MEFINLKCSQCSSDMVTSMDCKSGHNICNNCMIINCPLCRSKLISPVNLGLQEIIRELDAVILRLTDVCGEANIAKSEDQTKMDVEDQIPEEELNETDIKDGKSEERQDAIVKNERYEEQKEADNKDHEYLCEGAQFCNWKCKWAGNYDQSLKHFQRSHKENVLMQSQPFLKTKMNISRSSSTLSLIRLQVNGEEKLFWYKQKIDLEKKLVYLIIQYTGPKKESNEYFYEFTAVNNSVDILKIRQTCESSCENINVIIDEGRCGIIPFNIISNYVYNKEIVFMCKIELVKLEIERATCTNKVIRSKSKSYTTEPTINIKTICIPELENNDQNIVNLKATIKIIYNFRKDYFINHIFYTGEKETEKKFMFKCTNDLKRRNTCFLVQYFGEESIVNNYCYEIIVSSDPLISFKTQKKCRSLHEETTIMNEDGCAMIPFNVTKSCLNNNSEITFVLIIKETNCSVDVLGMDTKLLSYANIMEESFELQSTPRDYRHMFEVSLNEDNFPKDRVDSDPVDDMRLAVNHPELFNPVLYDFTIYDKMEYPYTTIFTKTTVNLEKNSAFYEMFAVRSETKEELFLVRTRQDTKSKMMHWSVEHSGTEDQARRFFYELSIYYNPSNFFKARKVCCSSCWDNNDKYIQEGKCVSLPFDSIKYFMNQKNEIFCTIKIITSNYF